MTIHKESHQDNVLCKFCCDQETLKKHYYRNHSHCMTCNKTFENIDGILYHLLLRHGLRYQCKYCPFSDFDFDENGLDIHMKNCLNNDEIQDVEKKISYETFEKDLIPINDTDVDEKKVRVPKKAIDSTNFEERVIPKNEIHDQTQVNIANFEEKANDLEGEQETVAKNSKLNSKPAVESDINTACLVQNSETYSFDASTMYSTIQHNVKVEDISENETSLDIENTRIIESHTENSNKDQTEEVGNATLTYSKSKEIKKDKKKQAKFNCEICGKAFLRDRDLKNHHSAIHLKVKPFRCEVADCGKYFAIESSKIRHVNIVHEKIKPHRCSTCQIDFSTKSQFDGHTERVHEKIRYDCNPPCTKSYSDPSNLSRHIKEIHSFDASTMYSTIQHNVKVEENPDNDSSKATLDIENTRIVKTHANKEEDGNNTLTYEGFDIQNLLLDDETYMLLDGKFDDISDEDLPKGQVL